VTLREATRSLHHAAESTPLGAAMADGTMPARWWCDWLGALRVVHRALDPALPPVLARCDELEADLVALLPLQPRPIKPAADYADLLVSEAARLGAAYVFTGAHLMGGAVTERRIGGRLPCAHLRWADRRLALEAWRPLRERADLEAEARAAFAAVLAISEAIAPVGA
jgi:heme oxygenase